ncbi:membrane dipeptidase, partial [Streptomyces sp. NPDC059701]
MADLQDDLHTGAEAGELDDLSVPLPDEAFPPEPYAPVSDPDDEPLTRAHAVLAAHPVADGYCGLPRALGRLPFYDLELGESGVRADVPRLR